MAHFSGLVAAGEYPNPLEYADVVTSTTHKTIRGARGGMILSNNKDLGKKFNSAVFPGYQGGPLMHVIAAKAVAFGEALKPEFKEYIKQVIKNAKKLSEVLVDGGLKIVSGGTDTHLLLVDLTPKNLTGAAASTSLENANITCKKWHVGTRRCSTASGRRARGTASPPPWRTHSARSGRRRRPPGRAPPGRCR